MEVESRSHFAIVNAKTAAPTICVSQNSVYGTACSVQGYSAAVACRFLLCQTPPKPCFVVVSVLAAGSGSGG